MMGFGFLIVALFWVVLGVGGVYLAKWLMARVSLAEKIRRRRSLKAVCVQRDKQQEFEKRKWDLLG